MSGLLNHSPADVVGQLLVDSGLVEAHTGTEWPTFINTNPVPNVQCLTTLDTAGFSRGKTHVDSESRLQYGVQLLARSPSPTLPFRKLNELLGFLDQVTNEIVALEGSTYNVFAVTATSPILRIGREQPEDVLTVCSLNLIVSLRQLQGS